MSDINLFCRRTLKIRLTWAFVFQSEIPWFPQHFKVVCIASEIMWYLNGPFKMADRKKRLLKVPTDGCRRNLVIWIWIIMLDKVTEMFFNNLFVVIINTLPTCKCRGRAKLYNTADYQEKWKESKQTNTFTTIILISHASDWSLLVINASQTILKNIIIPSRHAPMQPNNTTNTTTIPAITHAIGALVKALKPISSSASKWWSSPGVNLNNKSSNQKWFSSSTPI